MPIVENYDSYTNCPVSQNVESFKILYELRSENAFGNVFLLVNFLRNSSV
jgi:hypothetical protein